MWTDGAKIMGGSLVRPQLPELRAVVPVGEIGQRETMEAFGLEAEATEGQFVG